MSSRDDGTMRAAFEEAEVDAAEIERLEPAMTNDEKDRHVLAAAVAADSERIVTLDLTSVRRGVRRRLAQLAPRGAPGGSERAGHCCILGSCVGSAYMGGQP